MEIYMKMIEKTVTAFTEELASPAPVPGGGGASALAGAIGISLGDMVGELTTGKKKYADVEEDIQNLMKRAQALRVKLLAFVDGDAEAFAPLAKAYGIPKDDPGRDAVMENALRVACGVPMDILRACAEAIDIIEEFAAKGSRLAISDAGCGAILCKAAMQAASLNIYINTKSMKDRALAQALEAEADALLSGYTQKADDIFNSVMAGIRS
jgi:formiminotetrahydrofolate cyclodeaminase